MGDVNIRIEAGPVLVPLIALLGAFLAVRALRGRAGPKWGWRFVFIRITAAVYMAGVLSFTLFPFHIKYGKWADANVWYEQINWGFLVTLDPSALPNVALTVPLGILLPLMSKKIGSSWRAIAFGAVFSLAIEVSQVLDVVLFHDLRIADVNDLLVNTIGCLLGYWIVRSGARIPVLGRVLGHIALPGSVLATEPRGVVTAPDSQGAVTTGSEVVSQSG